MTVQRRLAAILAADVAGYSRLMGEDEAGTLSAAVSTTVFRIASTTRSDWSVASRWTSAAFTVLRFGASVSSSPRRWAAASASRSRRLRHRRPHRAANH